MINAAQFPLLDHISSGILAIDSEAHIVLWNERMECWTGMPRDQLIGQNLFQTFPETAIDAFKTRIKQVLGGGAPVIFSPQLHHHLIACPLPGGAFRTQLVTITWLEQQQIALFSIQDLTEQTKLVEQYKNTAHELQSELDQRQLIEQEKLQLATAIDQAGEAVVITNRQGKIEYHNKAFLQQTGWNQEEIEAIGMYHSLFKKTDDHFDRHLEAQLEAGQTWQGRKGIMRKDGSDFTASISIAPISNQEGEPSHHIIIQEDISQHLALEEKLRHTQKQEALITLIGGIAHDFNNLLAGLVGQVYLASREVKELPKTTERMQKIQGIAQEAAEIVKQLLTFARQGEHDAKEFSLNSFIKEFIKLARHSVPENIKLSPDFDADAFPFRGDADQLQQALLNIIQNSVDACEGMNDRHIEIGLLVFHSHDHAYLLKKYPVLRHGNFAHILIRDNGKGIPADIADKIFDPFFSTKQLGSGLGLAIVMGCVRHHHGIVDVENLEDGGTCMHLFLPTIKRETAPVVSDNSNHICANILLVDDDLRVLEPTRELLECMGHHITLAKDGIEACQRFEQQPDHWDIVITDMVMPRMNGLEASIKIRQLRPDIPVIFATGYDPSLVTDHARNMQNSKLISKPFNPDELDGLISKMVEKRA